jgi:hypothetical protein
MKRLIYSSRAVFDFTQDELVELLSISRTNNRQGEISGMLLYCGQSFLQMLEGQDDAVDTTFARIESDDRHSDVRLLMNAQVSERTFPDWSMGFEQLDDEDLAEQLEGYTPEGEYPLVNPELVSNGLVAERLLTLYARNKRA